jgi:cation transport ATPase
LRSLTKRTANMDVLISLGSLPHPMIGVVAMTASSMSVIGDSLLPPRRAAWW